MKLFHRCSNYRGMTVLANSLLNLTQPQLPDRRLNTGNGRSSTGVNSYNSSYSPRSYQEVSQNGQQIYHNYNAYPYYNNNGYPSRSRDGIAYGRPPNRSRGASSSNGYLQASQLHQNQVQIRSRAVSQSQAPSGATKYGAQNQAHYSHRTRGPNVNGFSTRGNGN